MRALRSQTIHPGCATLPRWLALPWPVLSGPGPSTSPSSCKDVMCAPCRRAEAHLNPQPWEARARLQSGSCRCGRRGSWVPLLQLSGGVGQPRLLAGPRARAGGRETCRPSGGLSLQLSAASWPRPPGENPCSQSPQSENLQRTWGCCLGLHLSPYPGWVPGGCSGK